MFENPSDKSFEKYDLHKTRSEGRGDEKPCECQTCRKVRRFLSSRTQPLTVVEVRHG